MEIIGDLERTFASAIYPNRLLVSIAAAAIVMMIAVIGRRRRWDRAARRHPRATASGAVLLLAIGLPTSWYLGSPLFLSTTVDEPPPLAGVEDPVAATSPTDTPSSSAERAIVPPAAPTPTPVALIDRAGHFVGADEFHFGKGTARLIETAPGAFTVRLQDFAVRNGPDLYVYLSPKPDRYAKGAIELGRLKADRGNQNYAVPPGTDVATAASVVIWCKRFSVLFAAATLE